MNRLAAGPATQGCLCKILLAIGPAQRSAEIPIDSRQTALKRRHVGHGRHMTGKGGARPLWPPQFRGFQYDFVFSKKITRSIDGRW